MSDEKNFLQTIKLEISRNFRLEPYERKAFHSILAFVKSQQGRDILVREIEKGGDIRLSALGALSRFDDPSLVDLFIQLLEKDLTDEETILVLNYLAGFTDERIIPSVINLIEKNRSKKGKEYLIRIAFCTLKKRERTASAVSHLSIKRPVIT